MTRQNQKQLPKGWKWVRLGEVIEYIFSGGTPNTKIEEYYNGNILWLNSKEVKNNRIYTTERTITEYGLEHSNAKWVKPNSVIIAMYGTTASMVAVNKIPLTTNQACAALEIDSIKADYNYIFYALLAEQKNLKRLSSGVAQQNLNLSIIKDFQIPLPPLPEQKAIAEVLSSLDDKIELLQEQNKTLEEMAQTLFRKWFIDNPERKRWKKVRLGDGTLATIIKSGIEPFTGHKTYLATRDVQGLEIVGGTPIMYNSRPSRANMQPSVYSVWFAKKWGVQKLLMFDEFSNNVDDYVLSTGFLGLKTKPETHYYIWLFVITDEFQEIKDTLVSGSVQPDITNAGVMKILIEAPPIKLLGSFNHKVKGMFAKISANKRQVEVLRDLRDLLLPKLISGEVRVKI